MPIYKPTELKEFLTSLGISPRKQLSQNFLIDGNIIRKIVSAAHVQKDEVVLEIGSGPGSLTEALLATEAKVIAVEKDPALAQALHRFPQLEVFNNDILDLTLENILPSGKAKVVANLPYHVTTPILAKIIPMHERFSECFVMVQEEVARRFVAFPGTAEYSSFTIFLNFFSDPTYLFPVSRNCFYPVPKVDSAVVCFALKEPPKINQEHFFSLTRTAFSQRRKMLRASLKKLYPSETICEALESLKISPQARPEELSLEQWIAFAKRMKT